MTVSTPAKLAPVLRRRTVSPEVEQRALSLGYTPLQARIIAGRLGPAFVDSLEHHIAPRPTQLDGPALLPDIEPAVERICRAIKNCESLITCCDYDCDGVSGATVLIISILDVFGHPKDKHVHVVGNRMRDGYGVSSNVTERIIALADGKPALMITADQGSTDEVRIAQLLAHGIETVVTDHHGIPAEGPPKSAIACVNPMRADGQFPDRYIAGVHVAFLVMCAVRNRLIEIGHLPSSTPTLNHLCDIVSMGVVADAVSIGKSVNNRAMVRHGLRLMSQPDARPAWQALRRLMNKSDAFVASDNAFTLGPLANAAGRLNDAMTGVKYLLSKSEDEAWEYLQQLDTANKERRAIEHEMKEKALEVAALQVDAGRAGIVVHLPDGHPGVVGIVASRLVEAFGRPTVVFAPKHGHEGRLTGSGRSIPDVNIRTCLSEIGDQCPDLQKHYGGHAGACGSAVDVVDLAAFSDAFDAAVRRQVDVDALMPVIWVDGELPAIPSLAGVNEMAALEPYGREFETPVFTMDATVRSVRPVGADGRHLKLQLACPAGRAYQAIWFNAVGSDGLQPVSPGDVRQFAYELDANTFRNQTSLQLKIRTAA